MTAAPATSGRATTLGLDIGGTNIKWMVVDEHRRPAGGGSVPTPQDGPTSVVDELVRLHGAVAGRVVRGVGVAVPGHVEVRTGHTRLVPNLPGHWDGFPLGPRLGHRLHTRVEMVNDARAFAAAELAAGAVAGTDRAVFATVGTGIGGAIALDGRIRRDEFDSVGELGHATVVRDGELCGCGNHGCAEAYAGVRAITRRYRRQGGAVAGDDLMAHLRLAYDRGEPAARDVIDTAAWALGCAITNLAVTLRIPTVVLGGGLAARWPQFATEIRRQLAARASLVGPCRVHVSVLGDTAGALGAAMVFDSLHPFEPAHPETETDITP